MHATIIHVTGHRSIDSHGGMIHHGPASFLAMPESLGGGVSEITRTAGVCSSAQRKLAYAMRKKSPCQMQPGNVEQESPSLDRIAECEIEVREIPGDGARANVVCCGSHNGMRYEIGYATILRPVAGSGS